MSHAPVTDVEQLLADAIDALRSAGARAVYLHGSRAQGQERPDSDIDLAAVFGAHAPAIFEVDLPPRVDLLVLDDAPVETAGLIALHGRLLFEADHDERVHWEARTRKIYFDERPRIERSRAEFLEAMSRG